MPRLVISGYEFEWRYNQFSNSHFVDVKKGREVLLVSYPLAPGQWPIVDGMLVNVDYSKVPTRRSNDHEKAIIEFYPAYPVDQSKLDCD
ncbi:MAG: hypothetical protein GKR96_04270 [Gammaproteobacteria bacterium]|nr:hypothetical protein [Gammaproteobacteria bacterium]